ncbi:MAG: PD-(D/E)XK nuclease family protein [Thermoleophilaceae bacterium]
MPLALVTGPANSGKTGELLDRFTGALAREPVLVLPTSADVRRFEEELLARRPVAVGGRILTFGRLFESVAQAVGAVTPPALSAHQRDAVLAVVAREAPLEALAGPARRRGFAAALGGFVDEAQAARLTPAELAVRLRGVAARGAGDGGYLRELAVLCERYAARVAKLGRADAHDLAGAAIDGLTADPAAWGGRPVFLYGFDDLTYEQLALVEGLSRAAEVVVALVHEPGRACLVARERLLARLQSLGAEHAETLPPHEGPGLLSHLERGFLALDAPRREPGEGLVLLEASGERNEVEQVGAEIASLLRAGAAPEDMAVIVRAPEAHAALIEQVFASYGIPAAIDAQMPFGRTVLGRGLVALLRAALVTRSAADLVAYLRTPGRAATPNAVDRLERDVRVERRETVDEAEEAWLAEERRELWELRALREAAAQGPAALVERVAELARDMFEWARRRQAPVLDRAARRDQLASEQAGRALAELAELCAADPGLAPDAAGLAELLDTLAVWRSGGDPTGCVEVMSPYRARARRYPHVFVLSLQEGEFPRRGSDDPFLTESERVACGLPQRADQRDEERYLFYSAISRALRRLHLSWRGADDDGRELARSFFVDDVLDLLTEDAEGELVRRKSLSDTVFEPARAPTELELARSLAAWERTEAPAALGAGPALSERLAARLARARERADFLPGDLVVDVVREDFAQRGVFGASSLESYAECPFRYFVGHELRPRPLRPDDDALARGGLLHRALELVYEECRGVTAETVEAVVARAREILAEQAEGGAMAPVTPAARATYRRMESDLIRFIRHDARQPVGLPVHTLEAAFGGREGDEHPALELGEGVRLHGNIDRVDGTDGGNAFIHDYKSGSSVVRGLDFEAQAKLQLPLYMLAVKELWGMRPVGAVYHPLGKQYDAIPRGLLRRPEGELPEELEQFKDTDFADDADFDEQLERARRGGIELAHQIQSGHLGREPLDGACPRWCDLHAICRRDRGAKNPPENGERPPVD